MATISAGLVKDLREKTGAGMMDCKNALSETNGDIEQAVDWLRKKGLAKAAKKSGRVAAEGLVGLAVDKNLGVVVEVNSETDFVARNDDFQALVKGVLAVALDHAPQVNAETVLGAHYPDGGTVSEAIANAIATIGENMTLRRTHGLSVAEGAIGHYVHGSIADGLGRIGVIVGLKSAGDKARPPARDAYRRRQPGRARRRRARSGDGRARARGARREERRQAGERAREDCRIGAEDLL
jgi:elongation factor Ts